MAYRRTKEMKFSLSTEQQASLRTLSAYARSARVVPVQTIVMICHIR